MRKGWFKIRGVQDGDRTLEDQLRGLKAALGAASGKTVLDLGAAEGLISREFARAGAKSVHGVEIIAENVAVARKVCAGLRCDFREADVMRLVDEHDAGEPSPRFDIVLALAIYHKVKDPSRLVRFSADAARELLVVRMPGGSRDGVYSHKREGNERVEVAKICAGRGLQLERVERGPNCGAGLELVLYFRRK